MAKAKVDAERVPEMVLIIGSGKRVAESGHHIAEFARSKCNYLIDWDVDSTPNRKSKGLSCWRLCNCTVGWKNWLADIFVRIAIQIGMCTAEEQASKRLKSVRPDL